MTNRTYTPGMTDGRLATDERVLDEVNSRPRISWRGIFAGLVAGVAIQITLTFLGVAVGASTVSSTGGLAIGGLIWAAVTVIVSAYMAGHTAVRAGNQQLAVRGQFTGLITGMLMTLILTMFVSNTLLGAARGAGSVISTVTTGAATATAAAGTAAEQDPSVQNGVQRILGGLDEQSIGQIIGDNSPNLSQEQATAAARVVSGIIQRASNDLGSNLGNITNLSDFVTNRVNSIKQALSGEQFVTRLQRQGLSQSEAQATQTAITQQVTTLQKQATDAAAAAERIARSTASTAAWSSLLAAGLIIGFSALGGNQAASTRRKVEAAANHS